MFAIVIFARFLASFVVMVLMLVVRETPVLGTQVSEFAESITDKDDTIFQTHSQFLYYVAGLNRPLRWTVVALIVQVAWLNIFNVLDSASNANGPIINQVGSAVGCLTITAIALLIKSILVRFLAIGYHRGAYYGRIKSGLFAEFVLHSLLLGNKPKADGASRFINSPLSTLQSYVGLVRGNAPEVVEQAPGGNMSGHVAETVPAGASDHRNAVENDATGNTHVTKRNWWTFSRFRWGGNDRAGDRHNSSNSFTFDYIPMNEDEVTDKPISSHKLAVLVEVFWFALVIESHNSHFTHHTRSSSGTTSSLTAVAIEI